MPGLFVTFEGGEGSGKSTQIERLAGRLRARGIPPLITREPGGTPLAEAIRRLLLDVPVAGASEMDPRPGAVSEAFLLEAARADLVSKVIRPALDRGRVVFCDRYGDSTLAYQGGGRGLDLEALAAWNRAATGGLVPDLTLLFDLDARLGLERRAGAGGGNRLDREPLEFHLRVRRQYHELAAREPGRFVVLDASGAPDGIEAQAWAALEKRLAAAEIGTART
jgi:dTMP kinase